MKRTFDFCVALLALILLAPVFIAIAILIKVSSPGPVIFRQERIGKNFRPFFILKFRTMVVDAASRGPQITAGADDRITWIGGYLRKTKLDELPQLVNVLCGEMSFVGPRPEVARYVEMFRDDYAEVLRVQPGITDLASLTFRHESEILGAADDPEREYCQKILPAKISLSKEYLGRQSFSFDLLVIFKTIFSIFTSSKAAVPTSSKELNH